MFEVLILLLSVLMPANFPSSPVTSQDFSESGLVSVHQDASVSLIAAIPTEKVLVCAVADAASPPQGQQPAPVTTITTSWVDADHGTHTVSTPVPSSTPAGLQSSITAHRDLVRMMKIIYPPANP